MGNGEREGDLGDGNGIEEAIYEFLEITQPTRFITIDGQTILCWDKDRILIESRIGDTYTIRVIGPEEEIKLALESRITPNTPREAEKKERDKKWKPKEQVEQPTIEIGTLYQVSKTTLNTMRYPQKGESRIRQAVDIVREKAGKFLKEK